VRIGFTNAGISGVEAAADGTVGRGRFAETLASGSCTLVAALVGDDDVVGEGIVVTVARGDVLLCTETVATRKPITDGDGNACSAPDGRGDSETCCLGGSDWCAQAATARAKTKPVPHRNRI
jgi:hypothetical protein